MIPTMTASTPSRINEVDDDLSTDASLRVNVDVDMTGVPSASLGFPFVWPGCVAAAFRPSGCGGIGHRTGRYEPVFLGWPTRGRAQRPASAAAAISPRAAVLFVGRSGSGA